MNSREILTPEESSLLAACIERHGLNDTLHELACICGKRAAYVEHVLCDKWLAQGWQQASEKLAGLEIDKKL